MKWPQRAIIGGMFLPNQKVVCVDGQFPLGIGELYYELPKEGTTYTIRDIVPGIGLTREEGETAVYLCEITSPLNIFGIERGFRADRFAPLEFTEAESTNEASNTMLGSNQAEKASQSILSDRAT